VWKKAIEEGSITRKKRRITMAPAKKAAKKAAKKPAKKAAKKAAKKGKK
jgi:hypothetical protein